MANGSFTNFGSQKIADLVFGGVSWNAPNPIFMGYHLTASSDGAGGTEPSLGGYGRTPCTPEYFTTAINAEITTVLDIVCPRSTANQGGLVGIGFYDSQTDGNMISYIPINGSLVIETRDSLIVPAGVIRHSWQAGGFSLYLKNAILNHIYRATPLGAESLHYFAVTASTPTDTAFGSEPTGGNYLRAEMANNSGLWLPWAGGYKRSAVDIVYPLEEVRSWGTVSHIGIFNRPVGGQFLAYGAMDLQKSIDVNDQLIIDAGISIQID